MMLHIPEMICSILCGSWCAFPYDKVYELLEGKVLITGSAQLINHSMVNQKH